MQGRRDIPLSQAGRDDVAGWSLPADIAQPIDWVASPLLRAVATAQLLAGAAPRIEPALTEMDWVSWEGYSLAELQTRFGRDFERNESLGLDFRPPGGESPRDVAARVTRWLESAVERERAIVAVTHNGVLRVLLALATGWDMLGKPPVRLRPATLHRFTLERGPRLTIVACNLPLPRCGAPAGARDGTVSYPA